MGELENGVQGVQYGDDVLAPDLEPDEGNLEAIEREIAVAAQTRRALVVLVGEIGRAHV